MQLTTRSIDSQGAEQLVVLRADGFVDRLGGDHIHGNVHRAVEAELEGSPLAGD